MNLGCANSGELSRVIVELLKFKMGMRTVHGVFTTLLTRMYPILLRDRFVLGPNIVSVQ